MNAKPTKEETPGDYVVMTISMPKELKKALKLYALENDMNVSQVVRHIIRETGPKYGLNENHVKKVKK